ncbi:hypothetical protein D3C84_833300 [compost metagenome]
MELEGRAGRNVDPCIETQGIGRCGELRWRPAVGPWQPAAVDQQPQPGGLIVKRLQQFDPDLAIALAVIQQQAVAGVELAVQVNPAEGRIWCV